MLLPACSFPKAPHSLLSGSFRGLPTLHPKGSAGPGVGLEASGRRWAVRRAHRGAQLKVRAGERIGRPVCWGCKAVDWPFANGEQVTRDPATSATACH